MTHIERSVLVASDIMSTSVISVRPDLEIHEAINVLVKRSISGVPVVDGERMVGMLSGKDCLRVLAEESWSDALGGRVSDYMTAKVESITPDTDIFRIAGKFMASSFRRLPVLDGKKLVGMVSRGDVLRGILQMEQQRVVSPYPDYKRPEAPEKISSH